MLQSSFVCFVFYSISKAFQGLLQIFKHFPGFEKAWLKSEHFPGAVATQQDDLSIKDAKHKVPT